MSSHAMPPFIINITNFSEHKKTNNIWYSPPFYTGIGGYKMQIRVDANGVGQGKDTHVSVRLFLMKGVYDVQLKWPFKGDITIQLMNWREDKGHVECIIPFDNNTRLTSSQHVSEGERAPTGWGYHTFISHADLDYNPVKKTAFLRNDVLCFKVAKIVLPTGNCK